MFIKQANQNAWLWWVSILSLSIGLAIFILLQPTEQDYTMERYRTLSIIIPIAITGLCVIIGTSKRWFGKNL